MLYAAIAMLNLRKKPKQLLPTTQRKEADYEANEKKNRLGVFRRKETC